jgi:hypothetical protein
MHAERMQSYELRFREVERHPAGAVRMATGPERTVPEPYRFYAQVFRAVAQATGTLYM